MGKTKKKEAEHKIKPNPMVHINADITEDQKLAIDLVRERIGVPQSQQVRFGLTMYLETVKELWEEADEDETN